MRHTRSHTGNRRSHHGIKTPRLSQCANCSEWHLRHRACEHCGTYNERTVIDVAARDAKKAERAKKKAHARGIEEAAEAPKEAEEKVADKTPEEQPDDTQEKKDK